MQHIEPPSDGIASRRMTLPHPGRAAHKAAEALFQDPQPRPDQCWAAQEYAPYLRSIGKLPPNPRMVVTYPDRPGLRRRTA